MEVHWFYSKFLKEPYIASLMGWGRRRLPHSSPSSPHYGQGCRKRL